MGERPIRAMHGYHPDDPHSYASMLTNYGDIPESIDSIPHTFQLMTEQAERAAAQNRSMAAVGVS
jgi:hypothetical protein